MKTNKINIAKLSIISCLIIILTIMICGISFGWFQYEIAQPVNVGTIQLGSIDLSLEGYIVEDNKAKIINLPTTNLLVYDGVSNEDRVEVETMFDKTGMLPGEKRTVYFSVSNIGNLNAEFIVTFFTDMDNLVNPDDVYYLNNVLYDISYLPGVKSQETLTTYIQTNNITPEIVSTGRMKDLTKDFKISSLKQDPNWNAETDPIDQQFDRVFDSLQASTVDESGNPIYDSCFFKFEYVLDGTAGEPLEPQYYGRKVSVFVDLYGSQENTMYGEVGSQGYTYIIDNTKTLQENINAILPGDTIVLNSDIEIEGDLSINRLVNIVTNCYTLTVHGNIFYNFVSKGSALLDVRNGGKVICDNNFDINTPKTNIQIVGDPNGKNQLIVKGNFIAKAYLDNTSPIKTDIPLNYDYGLYLNHLNTSIGDIDNTPISLTIRGLTRVIIGKNTTINKIESSVAVSNIEILNFGIINQIDMSSMLFSSYIAKHQLYIWNNGIITGVNGIDQIALPYGNNPVFPTEFPSVPYNVIYNNTGTIIEGYTGNTHIEKGINSNEIKIKDGSHIDYNVYGFLSKDIVDPYEFVYVRKTNPYDSEDQEYDVHFKHLYYKNDSEEEYLTLQEAWENSDFYGNHPTKINIICAPGLYFNRTDITKEGLTSDFLYIQNNFDTLEGIDLSYANLENNTIPTDAMKDLVLLSNVSLPHNIEIIKTGAFANTAIEEITIPSTVTTLENDAFTTVKYIHIETTNVLANVYEGFDFSTNSNRYVFVASIPNYQELIDSYRITYKNIASKFYRASNLDDSKQYFVALDGNYYEIVVYVGINSFDHEVVIPNRITCNLKESTVYSYGPYSFYKIDGTKVINSNNIEKIGAYAFYQNPYLTTINIENVIEIDEYAFYENSLVTTLCINKVQIIGKYSFYKCNIESQMILNNVTTIGSYAFAYNKIPIFKMINLTNVGSYAFAYNSILREIYLGQLNEASSNYLFLCSNLQFVFTDVECEDESTLLKTDPGNWGSNWGILRRVYVPSNCIEMYKKNTLNTFSYNTGVFEIGKLSPTDVDNNISQYQYTFTKINEHDVRIVSYNQNITSNIIIPEEVTIDFGDGIKTYQVTEIGDCSFSASRLSVVGTIDFNWELTLNNNITKIEDYAFYYLTGLTRIKGGYNVEYVGIHAFHMVTSTYASGKYLTGDLNFYKVKYLGEYAFSNTYFNNLYLYSLETLGARSFETNSGNNYFEEIHFGNTSYFGYCAFNHANNTSNKVKRLFLYRYDDDLANTTTIVQAVSAYISIENIFVPEAMYDQYMASTSLCHYKTDYIIPFNKLESVSIDGPILSGDYYFEYNNRNDFLVKLKNDESLELTRRLNDNTIVNGEYNIPSTLFIYDEVTDSSKSYNITSLGEKSYFITSFGENSIVNIPSQITSIGTKSFYKKDKIVKIKGGINVATIKESAFESCIALTGELDFPNLITIEKRAFMYCSLLGPNLTLNNVIEVGEYAFYNCTGFKGNLNLYKATTISNYAFQNTEFMNLYLYSVNEIGTSGISRPASVVFKEIHLGNIVNKSGYLSVNNSIIERLFIYRIDNDFYNTTAFKGLIGCYVYNLFVPASMIDNYLNNSELRFNIDVKRVYPYNSINTISSNEVTFSGDYSFIYNESIENHQEYLVKQIDNDHHEIVKKLYKSTDIVSELIIPSTLDVKYPNDVNIHTVNITSLGEDCYRNVTFKGDVSVKYSSNLLNIGKSCFESNTNIISFIPTDSVNGKNLQSIRSRAFYGCKNLTSDIDFPNLTILESYAFYSCASLTGDVNLYNVESIGDYAFYDCKLLNGNLNLHNAITIGVKAFYYCDFKNLYLYKVERIEDNALCKAVTNTMVEEMHLGNLKYCGPSGISNSNTTVKKLFCYYINDNILGNITFSSANYCKVLNLFVPEVMYQYYADDDKTTSMFYATIFNVIKYNRLKSVDGNIVTLEDDGYSFVYNNDVEDRNNYVIKKIETYVQAPNQYSLEIVSRINNITNKFSNIIEIPSSLSIKTPNMSTTLTLPVTIIGERSYGLEAYFETDGLTLNIPDTIKEIEEYAFYNIKKICKIEGGHNIKIVGEYAFYVNNYIDVTKTNLNGDLEFYVVEKISDFAFSNNNFTNLYLYNINEIGANAFIRPVKTTYDEIHLGKINIYGDSCFANSSTYFSINKLFIYHNLQTASSINIGTKVFSGGTINNIFVNEDVYDYYKTDSAIRFSIDSSRITSYNSLSSVTYEGPVFSGKYSFRYLNNEEDRSEYLIRKLDNGTGEIVIRLKSASELSPNYLIPATMNVKLPNSTEETLNISSLNDYAFYNTTFALNTSLEFSDKLITIGRNNFENKTNIISISGGSNIEYIKEYAFKGCNMIDSSINFPKVIEIEGYAFNACLKLNGNVNLPNATKIGSYAFYNCPKLKGDLILNKCREIGDYAFDQTFFANYYLYSAQTIGNYAFYFDNNSTYINEVHIGNVLSFGDYCFISYRGWNEINIDKLFLYSDFSVDNTLPSMGTAYYENTKIKHLFVPEEDMEFYQNNSLLRWNVTTTKIYPYNSLDIVTNEGPVFIGNYSFTYDNNIENRNEYLIKKIGLNQGEIVTRLSIASSLTTNYIVPSTLNVQFPNSNKETINIVSIGLYAYYNTSFLPETTITFNDNLKKIGISAFENKLNITHITGGNNLEQIAEKAFYTCKGLIDNINFSKLTYLGNNAFFGCTALTGNVNLPSATYLGISAFSGCTGLNGNLVITNSTEVEESSFYNTRFNKIYAYSLQTIGKNAFYRRSTTTIDEVHLGSIKEYGESCFAVLTNQKTDINKLFIYSEIDYSTNPMIYGASFKLYTNVQYLFVPESKVSQYQNDSTLRWNVNINNILPYCSITAINGANVTFTNNYVLNSIDNENNINYADYLLKIEDYDNKIASIYRYLQPSTTEAYTLNNTYKANINSNNEIFTIKKILAYAYYNTTFATAKVTLPNSIEYIGDNAFLNKTTINELEFTPAGNITIGDSAFSGCTLMHYNLNFANTLSIGDNAFKDCRSVETISITGNVDSYINESSFIGQSAFVGCSNIASIAINRIYEIKNDAFKNITTNFELAITNVKRFGDNSFKSISVIIPSGLTMNNVYLGSSVFESAIINGDVSLSSLVTDSIVSTSIFKNTTINGKLTVNNVNIIDNLVFENVKVSGNVVISNINQINENAFKTAKFDGDVIVSNVNLISPNAFLSVSGNSENTTIINITTLSDNAFLSATFIRNLIIKETPNINISSFMNCTQMQTLDIEDIKIIKDSAFKNASNLINVRIKGNNSYTNNTIEKNAFGSSLCSSVYLEDIYIIKEYAFDLTKIQDLIINNSNNVNSSIIEKSAFRQTANGIKPFRIDVKNIYTISNSSFCNTYGASEYIKYYSFHNVYVLDDPFIVAITNTTLEYCIITFDNNNDIMTGIENLTKSLNEKIRIFVSKETLPTYYNNNISNAYCLFPIATFVGGSEITFTDNTILAENNRNKYWLPNYIIDVIGDDTNKEVSLYRSLESGITGDYYVPRFFKNASDEFEVAKYGTTSYQSSDAYKVSRIEDYAYYNYSDGSYYDVDKFNVNEECVYIGTKAFNYIKANQLLINNNQSIELGSNIFNNNLKTLNLVKINDIKSLTRNSIIVTAGKGVKSIILNTTSTAFVNLSDITLKNNIVNGIYTLLLVNSDSRNDIAGKYNVSDNTTVNAYDHLYIDNVIQNGITCEIIYAFMNDGTITGIIPLEDLPYNRLDIKESITLENTTFDLISMANSAGTPLACAVYSDDTLVTLNNNTFIFSKITSAILKEVTTIGTLSFAYCENLTYLSLPKLRTLATHMIYKSPVTELYAPSATTSLSNALPVPNSLKVLTLGNVTNYLITGGYTNTLPLEKFYTTAEDPTVFRAEYFENATIYVPYHLVSAYQTRYPSNTVVSFEKAYNNFLWDYYQDGVQIISYNGHDTNVVVPNVISDGTNTYDVISIKENAFDQSMNYIASITIPSTIKDCSYLSFNTDSLESIVVDDVQVGEGLDYANASLIPSNNKSQYYSYNNALYLINNGVSILVYYPRNCQDSIHEVEASTKEIYANAILFNNNSNLQTLDLTTTNNIVNFEDNAITNAPSTFTILVSDTNIDNYTSLYIMEKYLKFLNAPSYIRVNVNVVIYGRVFESYLQYNNTLGNCTFQDILTILPYGNVITTWYTNINYSISYQLTDVISDNISVFGKVE